ncbi:hypothetical protein PCASD_01286 [Puccinia coronata f. sp. avenae]|nr:hypothetical protein PCASD_01286 [Puccinia coronata f. sp. avenae]
MLLLRIFAIICSVPTPMISYMPMQDASKVKEPHLGSASGQQLVQDAVEPPNPLADKFNFKHDESAAGELGDSKVDNGDAIRDLRLRGKKPMEEAGSNKHLIDASTGPTSESSTTGVSVPAPAASFRERVVSASAAFLRARRESLEAWKVIRVAHSATGVLVTDWLLKRIAINSSLFAHDHDFSNEAFFTGMSQDQGIFLAAMLLYKTLLDPFNYMRIILPEQKKAELARLEFLVLGYITFHLFYLP